MALSTTQYGYIIDPLVPLTDDTGRTISNGYVRVFVAGSSTPVITYKNYDGATNEETVQLDNSGRTAYPVIGSKGSTYKVCVYDAEHSQESPIKTIDKVVPAGANVEATNIVTGLDNVESPEAGWVKSTVSGTDAEVSLDATNVTSEVDTMVKATAASADYMMPLVHKTGSDPDKKITLGNIFKFVLNFIHSLTDTAAESDLTSGNYIPLDGSAGTKKLPGDCIAPKSINIYKSCSANACVGYFGSASGGSVSISYARQGASADKDEKGIIVVKKIANYRVTALLISNLTDSCPLEVLFDGTRAVVKNKTNSAIDYNIISYASSFTESSALPASWDGDAAQEIIPNKIGPVDLSSYATRDELTATTTIPSGGYLGYSTNTGYNGAICVFWRYAGASGVTSGFFMFSKYSSTVNQTCICDTAGKCPFEVLVDGTRLVVKNKLSIIVYVKVVSKYEQFVIENALPPSWDADSASVVTTLKEINHVDLSSYATKSELNLNGLVSSNKLVGYATSAAGGGLFLAYRYSGLPGGTATGYALITRTAGTAQAVNISERSDGWPFRLLWDGTRFAVQNKLQIVVSVKVLGRWDTFVEGSEFPSNWNSANQQEIGTNVYQINRTDTISPNSFNVNRSQVKYLSAISRYRKAGASSQDFCAMIVTDSHGDWKSVDNARVCSDNFAPIEMLVHCGDVCDSISRGTESIDDWTSIVNAATKPVLFVVGNHEAGNYFNIQRTPTNENLYKIFIKPIVDKGFLTVGTYTENKLYYYKDFSGPKTRVIVLDEYEAPEDVDTTYWDPITYDSSYSDVANDTNYSAGDKVNVPGYTDYSFEAKSSFNSGAYYSGYQPKFKIRKGYRFISQAQAEWLVSTLNSVPNGYSVMICMHQVFSDSVSKVESKFTQTDWASSPTAQNVMATDLVALILKNFVAKTNQTISVSFSGEAAYVSGYSVDANFASNTSELKNICIVGGHYHRDVVVKNSDDLVQVLATTSNTTSQPNYVSSDIERPSTATGYDGVDSLTCVAVRDTGDTGLCKIGNNVTYYGTYRDVEIVKTL